MSKVNSILEDNIFIRYVVIISGMIISCIGVNGFLKPAYILSGGVAGLSVAINFLSGINIGLLTFIINIPLFILGFIYLEKEFLITSFINMVLFSLFLGITQGIVLPVDDVLLQAVFGGMLAGTGTGIIFRTKSSLGGSDLIATILKIKKNVPMKDTSMIINFFIVLFGGTLFGFELALYTLLAMFINVSTMNFIKDAMNVQKSVMLISKENELIAKEIMSTVHRGVTYIEAEGAYTHEKKKIIYCIVSSNEIPLIKEIALKYDKKSFISVNDVNEVKGRGFKEKFL
ncbi:MAG: YitT family protein [Peptostreptococcaceae bacterium]